MSTPVLSSTLLMTLLMLVGLAFFIRASVKDRTQSLTFMDDTPEGALSDRLQAYLVGRAYEVTAIDLEHQQTTFAGVVRPSVFLAVFLTVLAAVGTLCLSLVLLILLPSMGAIAFLPAILSPAAGIFYWRHAKRPETIVLKVEPPKQEKPLSSVQNLITVIAHRDELIQLRKAIPLTLVE